MCIRYLQSSSFNAPITNHSPLLPDAAPQSGIYTIDTSEMFAALEGSSSANKRGLERICILLDQHRELKLVNLHNAGNDAHVSL